MSNSNNVLITGANGGVGRALCSIFANEGYNVVAVDRNKQPHIDLVYKSYIEADLYNYVKDEAYATEVCSKIVKALPNNKLNCLVNNAAIQVLGGVKSLHRFDWDNTLAVNIQAPFFLTQSLLLQLQSDNGSVINISSIHARLSKKNFLAYATSKAALSGMTRAMAIDLGAKIRVNAIEPAAIATDMLMAGFNDKPELFEKLESYHPSDRIGEPYEIAQLACFLASDRAKFIHGSCIDISGGISNSLHDPN